ncbi:hypothetical protein CEXT_559911 [Caerostris extrusa]|uniref:Uncharacterized protein n=1 Tax=Caerostris extrusa TaxID=172846 RepID=A0AAV4PDS8_CAEEX|nr:hypothetical protein CEXT_559911 [Caerostris extrusa]
MMQLVLLAEETTRHLFEVPLFWKIGFWVIFQIRFVYWNINNTPQRKQRLPEKSTESDPEFQTSSISSTFKIRNGERHLAESEKSIPVCFQQKQNKRMFEADDKIPSSQPRTGGGGMTCVMSVDCTQLCSA